ncbi:hypothetical protein GQ44DRAFT_206780 [Phaeosphaeriaceae sp. PMI808]|nr:hypothetical protein GQ44DRAFT_206780 [Phaeosphaeriaceae sp. PMI808]
MHSPIVVIICRQIMENLFGAPFMLVTLISPLFSVYCKLANCQCKSTKPRAQPRTMLFYHTTLAFPVPHMLRVVFIEKVHGMQLVECWAHWHYLPACVMGRGSASCWID